MEEAKEIDISLRSIGSELDERFLEGGVPFFDEITEHMGTLASLFVATRDFDTRHEFDPMSLKLGPVGRMALRGVMVGEGSSAEARSHHFGGQFLRRISPIGADGVHVEIDHASRVPPGCDNP